MTNHKMDMIVSIADCYSKGTIGAEDAYLLTIRIIEGSMSMIELLHILAKIEGKPSVGHHYECNHDCDALYEAYHKGFFEGYEERKEEEKKKTTATEEKRKAILDDMNEAMRHEFKICFFGEKKKI